MKANCSWVKMSSRKMPQRYYVHCTYMSKVESRQQGPPAFYRTNERTNERTNNLISSAPRKKKRTHIPKLKVWKLREPNVKQEFARLVIDRKDEIFEAENVESK